MMFWGHHMGFGGWGLLLNVALWIGLIALGVWLLARLFPGARADDRHSDVARSNSATTLPADTASSSETAMEIVRRRYARGEIDKEEYETIRHDLAS